MLDVHYFLDTSSILGAMLLAAAALARSLSLRRQLSVREASIIQATTRLFWAGAFLVLASHLVLWLSDFGKGPGFYLRNGMVWLEVALFGLVVFLEVRAGWIFRSWTRFVVLEQAPWFTDAEYDRLRRFGRIQVVLLFVIPLIEPLVNRGVLLFFP
jgi:uncharacterized membrane protein